MLSNFDQQSVYSMEPQIFDPSKKVYQLCLSDSRSKVLTVIKEKYLKNEEKDQKESQNPENDDFEGDLGQNKRQRLQENSDDSNFIKML